MDRRPQVVNGWNNVVDNNGGVTIGLTSVLTEPKFGWALNYYTGPENTDTQKGYRNLIDTTLTLTPTSKLSAYVNYDYGQNRTPALDDGYSESSLHWQGVAFAARARSQAKRPWLARYEYYDDQGFETGVDQDVQEFTATYEYKWLAGLLMRAEFRRDWSNQPYFHKGDSQFVDAQTTATLARDRILRTQTIRPECAGCSQSERLIERDRRILHETKSLLLELLISGFFAIACLRARPFQGIRDPINGHGICCA